MVACAAIVAIFAAPQRGLRLFALVAPFVPFSAVNLGVRITVSELLIALTWLAIAWQGLHKRWEWPSGTVERRMVWLIVWSLVPLVAGAGLQAEGSSIANWIRWVLDISLLFLVPLLVRDASERDRLLTWLLMGYLLLLLLSIGVFLKDRDARSMIPVLTQFKYAHPEALEDIFSAGYTRMASPWVHPNATGGALLLAAPLAMFYGVAHSGWRRALGFTVALLGAAGIVFSGSRGALLALAALLAWMAIRGVPYTARLLGIGAVVAVALLTFYPPAQERIASLFSSGDVSTGVRFDEYRRFPEAMARFPLGVGFKVDPPPPNTGLLGISNLWLNYIYKLGVPGLLIFLAITRAWWREVRDFGDVRHLTPRTAVRFGSVGCLLAAFFTGFIDHYYSFTQVLISLFWLILAISLQEARDASPPRVPALHRRKKS